MNTHDFYCTSQSHHENAPAITLIFADTLDCIPNSDQAMVRQQQFLAQVGQVAMMTNEKGQWERAYIGLGQEGKNTAQVALAKAIFKLPEGVYQPQHTLEHRAAVAWGLSQYQFTRYQSTKKQPRVLFLPDTAHTEVIAEVSAIFKVRDLINAPTNLLGPKALADEIEDLGKTFGASVEIIAGDDLLKQNYPAIHAVGRAGEQQPRLCILRYGDPTHPKVSFVGKGVCFDSGGLDLKPARAMRYMKKDMGGAANAIGLTQWLMTLNMPIYIELLIPAVENNVSHNAYRPGDVLTMRNGLTVEIDNTDAEGRLVMADAIVKACESKPDLLVDFSTLTGAARVAVGTEITAMFSNNQSVANELLVAAENVGDPLCQLPLYQGYRKLFKSSIADFANSGASSYAGAIVAALFLEHFVSEHTPWIHYDFMAWNVTNRPGHPEGGEAMGIQALAAYLKCCYSK